MRTEITILHPEGQQVRTTIDLPARPKYGELSNAMRRFLGQYETRGGALVAELMERLPALVDGQEHDLLVCELGEHQVGTRAPMAFNAQATALYRAVTLAERPDAAPETLAKVCGPAVLFTGRKIWFEGEI